MRGSCGARLCSTAVHNLSEMKTINTLSFSFEAEEFPGSCSPAPVDFPRDTNPIVGGANFFLDTHPKANLIYL